MAPVSTPDKHLAAEQFGDMVEVKVGKGKARKTFFLHKGVLSFHSGYFESALKETFKEGKSGTIVLKDENPAVFTQFEVWLYLRRIDYSTAMEAESKSEDYPRYQEIIDLWIFADYFQVPLLANTMMDDLQNYLVATWRIPLQRVAYVYKHTIPGSRLRYGFMRLVASQFLVQFCDRDDVANWPAEALLDCLRVNMKLKAERGSKYLTQEEVAAIDMCEYHAHEEGVKCAKK